MIIRKRLPLRMIVARTWQESLLAAAICLLTFAADWVLPDDFVFPAIVPTLLGTTLAFFIGFSNNQAYDRWWEARIVWGAITNESRSWARGCLNYLDGSRDVAETMALRHIAFVYVLKGYLRGEPEADCAENYRKYLSDAEFAELQHKQSKQNALLDWQSRDLARLRAEGALDGFAFLELDQRITALCDEMGKAERIRNTVFPPTYHYYTKMFVWVFVACLTLVMLQAMGPFGVLIGFVLGDVFLVSQGLGMTLINPFEPTISGTPLDQISRSIEINLLELLGRSELPAPVHSVHDDYVM